MQMMDKFQPINNIMSLGLEDMPTEYKRSGRGTIEYINVPVSYDIETTSFMNDNNDPVSITYSHCLNIDGNLFLMRTWAEFKEAIDMMTSWGQLHEKKRVIVYVHHLAYEFQFMKHHFNFINVPPNGAERKIMTALTDGGIEFRCSYMLSGTSLKNVAKNLVSFDIKKMDGDLDYSLMRTPETSLSDEELGYIINDVVIIEYYIRELMMDNGNNITKIPATQTGFIREYMRNITIKNKNLKKAKKYRELMSNLTLTGDEYLANREAFSGGFTHANIQHVGKVATNVTARDFASSYPGRMLTKQFPMGKGEIYYPKSKDDFFDQLENYCCLFYVKFSGIARTANESYLSTYKAEHKKTYINNNGRIDQAVEVEMWMTEVDFECVMMSYEIDDFDVFRMYRYERGYLPTEFIEGMLKLYADKTELKDVAGKEAEYNLSKGMLNSTYGMCVTDIARDIFTWDDLTKTHDIQKPVIEEVTEENNQSKKRFLFYPWGVWITAHARYELFEAVVQLGDDYVYCDTDSIYYTNAEKHQRVFDAKNEEIMQGIKDACDHHGIDINLALPKTPDGVVKPIGVWDFDGFYTRFKTLGAKRYMVEKEVTDKDTGEKSLEINITVSGINKNKAVPWLLEEYGHDGIFEAFDHELHVPEGACGKSTHTYIDKARVGVVEDYEGNSYEYLEMSGIHLKETFYTMKISSELREFAEEMQKKK